MTKSELVEQLASDSKLTSKKAEQVVNVVFDAMTETLVAGGRIEIRGFGCFTIREYEAYTGRNPKTGELIQVEPKKSPFFKVGKNLLQRIMGS